MTVKELEKRVADLEAEIAKLKADRTTYVIHSHYNYGPYPTYIPCYPQVWPNYPLLPQPTWGGQGGAVG